MSTIATTEYVVAADAPAIVVDVAADVGNARTVVLVRSGADEAPTAIMMPSIRTLHGAFAHDLFAARGLPAGSWGRLGRDEHIIERDGIERFVGMLAVEHIGAKSSGRGSDQRYYDGTTLDFILAGIAAALPKAARITVNLTTMIPFGLWTLAQKVEQALRGTHKAVYNGRAVEITIRSVTVRREGEAAFAALEGDTSGPVVLIDGGGRTINIVLFRDGEVRSGKTLELGVQAALDNLDRVLVGRGLRALTLRERGELENALIGNADYGIIVHGERVMIGADARRQLDATAHALAQEVHACVPLEMARRVVFVGGAAHAALFGAKMRSCIERCEVAGLRELANAYGALGGAQPKKGKGRK